MPATGWRVDTVYDYIIIEDEPFFFPASVPCYTYHTCKWNGTKGACEPKGADVKYQIAQASSECK